MREVAVQPRGVAQVHFRALFVDPAEPLRQQVATMMVRGHGELTDRQLRAMAYDLIPSGCKLLRYELIWV